MCAEHWGLYSVIFLVRFRVPVSSVQITKALLPSFFHGLAGCEEERNAKATVPATACMWYYAAAAAAAVAAAAIRISRQLLAGVLKLSVVAAHCAVYVTPRRACPWRRCVAGKATSYVDRPTLLSTRGRERGPVSVDSSTHCTYAVAYWHSSSVRNKYCCTQQQHE